MLKIDKRKKYRIYSEIVNFCTKRGLIENLEKSFLIPEEKRFNEMNIGEDGLDVLDAVHCIYDKKRTEYFIDEILEHVSEGDVVIEAGIGTGILSFYAASCGARVYGCEINPHVFKLAQEIKTHLEKEGLIQKNLVEFILTDATVFVPKEKANFLISENLYTGMFFEQQVQIMRHLSKFLVKGGQIVPSKMTSSLALSEIDRNEKVEGDKKLIIPSKETNLKVVDKILAAPYLYDTLHFKKISKTKVYFTKLFEITKKGKINSIMITSEVTLPSEKTIKTHHTTFLNNKIYIMLKDSLLVEKGDKVSVYLSYKYGEKTNDILLKIKKQ